MSGVGRLFVHTDLDPHFRRGFGSVRSDCRFDLEHSIG